MKTLAILFALAAAALAGDPVKFADDRYELTFPAGWKKADAPNEKALVPHENADGSALFAVNLMPVPEGAKPDLDGTAKDIAGQMSKGLGMKEDPEIQEGELDGLPARFVTMVPTAEGAKLGMILAMVEGKKEVLVLQATVTVPAKEKTREDCLAIVKSFRRADLPAKKD